MQLISCFSYLKRKLILYFETIPNDSIWNFKEISDHLYWATECVMKPCQSFINLSTPYIWACVHACARACICVCWMAAVYHVLRFMQSYIHDILWMKLKRWSNDWKPFWYILNPSNYFVYFKNTIKLWFTLNLFIKNNMELLLTDKNGREKETDWNYLSWNNRNI